MKKIILFLIKIYQFFLPVRSIIGRFLLFDQNTCRFRPTCSQYMIQAVSRYGIMRGGFIGIKRLVRCHPFNAGGFDPVPVK
jgi:uncharacterized protein